MGVMEYTISLLPAVKTTAGLLLNLQYDKTPKFHQNFLQILNNSYIFAGYF